MPKFIVQDQSKADKLSAELENSHFISLDNFVSMYNSGLINQSHSEVSRIAEEIIEAYKGIEKRGRNLYFLSSNEISIDELSELVSAYSVLIPMKRAISDSDIDPSTSVKISNGRLVATILEENEDGFNEIEEPISDKIVNKTAPIELMSKIARVSLSDESIFTASDILDINFDRVESALEQLSNY